MDYGVTILTNFGGISAARWEFQLQLETAYATRVLCIPEGRRPTSTGLHAGIVVDAMPPHRLMPGGHFFPWTLLAFSHGQQPTAARQGAHHLGLQTRPMSRVAPD